MENYLSLAGASGVSYSYRPMTIDAPWDNAPGNYAFASQIELGHWQVYYVGEASSLRECLPSHDLWPKAAALGCTHVLAHVNDDGAQARQLEERDLVAGLNPPMNRKYDPMALSWE
jgi:hypothetical protein